MDTQEHIRSLFEEGVTAWNKGDLETYLASYWDSDKTRLITGGRVIRGSQAIRSAYQDMFGAPERMGRFEVTDLEVDLLTEQDALVYGQWLHTYNRSSRLGVFTLHMKNIDGQWLVVSDHTSMRNLFAGNARG
jgi:uncharacterized protein (TIGR02246 family)